ncbi:MAG TPA: hypothetical protein VFN63_13475 [Pseudolabrys sp.]|nr:hypothetical protein [Pseudolabrys sp.]
MKRIPFAVAAVAVLFLAQPGTAVSGPGGGKGGSGFKSGGHGHHAMNNKGHWWKNNNNGWWYATNNGQLWWQNNKSWYAGYGGVYATQPAVTETVAVPVAVAVEVSRPCQRVQQPITVRSEDGGERVVSVTRCQN